MRPPRLVSYGVVCTRRTALGGRETLVIRRRHSVGFLELVRGRWRGPGDVRTLLGDLFPWERDKLRSGSFEGLWRETTAGRSADVQRARFARLQADLDAVSRGVRWRDGTREWEFPKGRPLRRESPRECARREFQEETGVPASALRMCPGRAPAWERHVGMDGRVYWNAYFLADVADVSDVLEPDAREVGEVAWVATDALARGLRRESLVRVASELL